MLPYSKTGLTASPWADTASPAANTLRAALMSRSCFVSHSGQVQARTDSGIEPWVWPQTEHRLLDGYQRSMPISVRPYHRALYSSCLTNSDQLASAMDFDRLRWRCMLLTERLSMAITWFSLTIRVESLCRKSLRESVMRACTRATFNFNLLRFFEPGLARATRRWYFAKARSFFLNALGAAIFSPFDTATKCVRPRSIPISLSTAGLDATASSHRNEAKYRPAASLEMVTVVSFAALGMVLDHRIASGSLIFARRSSRRSGAQRNALVVYSADCGPSLRLKDGYRARLAKKLEKAVFRCRKACCTGTLLTSFSHACSDVFFSAVRAAEVS